MACYLSLACLAIQRIQLILIDSLALRQSAISLFGISLVTIIEFIPLSIVMLTYLHGCQIEITDWVVFQHPHYLLLYLSSVFQCSSRPLCIVLHIER